MKKLIALILAAIMMTGTVAAVAEQTAEIPDETEQIMNEIVETENGKLIRDGVEYALYLERIPEGYTQTLTTKNGYPEIEVICGDPSKPEFYANLECDDALDSTINYATLSDENKEAFRREAESYFSAPETTEKVTDHGTPFLLIDESDCPTDWALLTTLYKGFFVNVYVFAGEDGVELTEEDLQNACQIMSDIWPIAFVR